MVHGSHASQRVRRDAQVVQQAKAGNGCNDQAGESAACARVVPVADVHVPASCTSCRVQASHNLIIPCTADMRCTCLPACLPKPSTHVRLCMRSAESSTSVSATARNATTEMRAWRRTRWTVVSICADALF